MIKLCFTIRDGAHTLMHDAGHIISLLPTFCWLPILSRLRVEKTRKKLADRARCTFTFISVRARGSWPSPTVQTIRPGTYLPGYLGCYLFNYLSYGECQLDPFVISRWFIYTAAGTVPQRCVVVKPK